MSCFVVLLIFFFMLPIEIICYFSISLFPLYLCSDETKLFKIEFFALDPLFFKFICFNVEIFFPMWNRLSRSQNNNYGSWFIFLFCNMQGMIVPHFTWRQQFLSPDCHIFPVVSNAGIKAYQWQWLGRSLVWCSLCIVVHCKQWRFWSLSHVKSTDVHMDKVLLVFMNIFPCRKDFF